MSRAEHGSEPTEAHDALAAYYAARAAEYERIYAKPERRAGLASLRETIGSRFAGRRVLEIALRHRLLDLCHRICGDVGARNRSSTPIARTDSGGNTYQLRTLADGSTHEVLKNFPTREELHAQLRDAGGIKIVIDELRYYWTASYVVGPPRRAN
jgi:hypothetical protein